MNEKEIEEKLDDIVIALGHILSKQENLKQVNDLLLRLDQCLPEKIHLKRHTNEFVHDTLEVCAMIFQGLQGISSTLQITVFTYGFICKLLFLTLYYVQPCKKRKRLLDGAVSNERNELACDVLFLFLQLARRSKDTLENVIRAWQESDISIWIHKVNTKSKQLQYLTFFSEFIFKKSISVQLSQKKKALQYLLGNNDICQWKSTVWEKKWQVYTFSDELKAFVPQCEQARAWISSILNGFTISQDPSHFENTIEFLSAFDMENWLGLRVGVDVFLVKNGSKHDIWHDSLVKPAKKISSQEAIDVFQQGYTLGIRGVQARCLRIHQLCRHLEAELGQYVNANIYYTPAHEQGFEWHIDDHCGKCY
jgi:hypothetical protein